MRLQSYCIVLYGDSETVEDFLSYRFKLSLLFFIVGRF